MQMPETKRRRITKAQIKKWIAERMETIPTLEVNAEEWGPCYVNQKLGFARGYVYAMKEILGERD